MSDPEHPTEPAAALETILNELLAREVSATDAYLLAVAVFDGRPRVRLLEEIAQHHEDAATFFRSYLVENGGRILGPSEPEAGLTVFRREWPRANPDASVYSIVALLREGEFTTLQDHQRALGFRERLTEEVRQYLRDVLIPRATLHLDALDVFAQIDPRE